MLDQHQLASNLPTRGTSSQTEFHRDSRGVGTARLLISVGGAHLAASEGVLRKVFLGWVKLSSARRNPPSPRALRRWVAPTLQAGSRLSQHALTCATQRSRSNCCQPQSKKETALRFLGS